MAWSDAVCRSLTKLHEARQACKVKERELVQERKTLEGRLDELGAGDTKEHLRTSRDYVIVLRQLDYWRDRTRSLADKIGEAIEGAPQGRLFDDDATARSPSESDLFVPSTPADVPGQGRLDDRPVGQAPRGKKAPPAPAHADGVDEHLQASVAELELDARLTKALIAAGMTTVAHLANEIDRGMLGETLDWGEGKCAPVIAAVKKYRKVHRHAARQANGA